jgi:hypothetical protein
MVMSLQALQKSGSVASFHLTVTGIGYACLYGCLTGHAHGVNLALDIVLNAGCVPHAHASVCLGVFCRASGGLTTGLISTWPANGSTGRVGKNTGMACCVHFHGATGAPPWCLQAIFAPQYGNQTVFCCAVQLRQIAV